MHLVLDRHSGLPVFRQLMDQVRFQVSGGVLAPGTELPSTRALAAEFGLNPMTVSKAYALLEAEGLLERRPGLSLVVRRQARRTLDGQRNRRLTAALRHAATAVRQLGVPRDEALELFAQQLDETAKRDDIAGDKPATGKQEARP